MIIFVFMNVTAKEKRRVIIVWWKNQEEGKFEVFSSLKVFCDHYPRFNYNTLSNYLSKKKTAYETEEVMVTRKVITQKGAAIKNPDFPKRLFWEFDHSKMNWLKSYRTVIARVIERGTEKDWKTMIDFYGRKKIIHTLKNEITFLSDHAIDKVTKTFNINPNELECYKRKQSRKQHWL